MKCLSSAATNPGRRTAASRWVDGVVTEAVRKGQWLLLDEINLADPAVLERINPLMDGDGFLVLTEKEIRRRFRWLRSATSSLL